jgi:four helix bundle protein
MQDFRKLTVWQKAHELVLAAYCASRAFPKEELFGLTSQMRRAASSIAANLAEGCGRTQPEFAHYVQFAFGSASELEYHTLLARDLGYLGPAEFTRYSGSVEEIKRMLTDLLKRIRLTSSKSQTVLRGSTM